VWGLKPVSDPRRCFHPTYSRTSSSTGCRHSHLLRRAFREVAVIGGLVERQHPGQRKTGRQVTFSTDLIYDVLQNTSRTMC
jgi:ATP-dependent helicase Lhr and Lhr-like helicase